MRLSAYVTLVGGYGAGNLGDDALMTAVLALVREVVRDDRICVRVEEDCEYLHRVFPSIRFVQVGCDATVASKVLLYGGGTQFFSFPNTCIYPQPMWRRGLRYAVNPASLYRRLFKSAKLSLESERSAAISIGIGPFVPKSRAEQGAERKLKRCEWVSVRDSTSYEYCRRLGLHNVRLHADLCFAKKLWMSETIYRNSQSSELKSIGIIMRDWPHDADGHSYIGPLWDAGERLRSDGFAVRYISFAPATDRMTVSMLHDRREEVLQWDPSTTWLEEFAAVLAGFDLLVTARAHGTIIGAALGIPSIAIELEPKLRLIGDQLRMGTEIWSPPFRAGDLVNQVECIGDHWDKYRSAIASEATNCAEDALAGGEALKDYLRALV